jgi:DNA-binding response OmpR family regulator
MDRQPVILVLGWEPITLSQLHLGLEDAGYVVETTRYATEALAWLELSTPALIVLDCQPGDPTYDPWGIARRLCEAARCPFVMLLAEGETSQCAEAFRLGADDCLVHPCNMQELVARIQRILWRVEEAGSGHGELSRLVVYPTSHTVTVNGTPVRLTPMEFRLLYALYVRAEESVTQQDLVEAVWGQADPGGQHRLKLLIWQLRRKLEASPRSPRLILTEHGKGYRLHLES